MIISQYHKSGYAKQIKTDHLTKMFFFRPEDIEEISDEEAEWSDEGDPIYPIDFDATDFGEDWDDPIKDFDYFSELKPLSFFSLRPVDGSPEEIGEKLEIISELRSKAVSTEWVDAVEQVWFLISIIMF